MPGIARPTELPAGLANGQHAVALLYGNDSRLCAGWQAYLSSDDETYSAIVMSDKRCVMGQLLTELPAPVSPDTEWEPERTFDVDLSDSPGELLSQSEADAQQGTGNYLLIGDELVTFATAELIADRQYRLTGIRRGWFDTEPAAHAVGDGATFIPRQVPIYRIPEHMVGATIYWKFVAKNIAGDETESLADLDPIEMTVTQRGARDQFHPGQTYLCRAGAAIAAGDLVKIGTYQGKVVKAVAGDTKIIGLAMQTVDICRKLYVLREGKFNLEVEGAVAGDLLYASDTPGELSTTPNGAPLAIQSAEAGVIWVDCPFVSADNDPLPALLGYDTGTAWQFIPLGNRDADFFCEVTAELQPELRVYGWDTATEAPMYGTIAYSPAAAAGDFAVVAPDGRDLYLGTAGAGFVRTVLHGFWCMTAAPATGDMLVNNLEASYTLYGNELRLHTGLFPPPSTYLAYAVMGTNDTIGYYADQRNVFTYNDWDGASAFIGERDVVMPSAAGSPGQQTILYGWLRWNYQQTAAGARDFGGDLYWITAEYTTAHAAGTVTDFMFGGWSVLYNHRTHNSAGSLTCYDMGYYTEINDGYTHVQSTASINKYGFRANIYQPAVVYTAGNVSWRAYGLHVTVYGGPKYGTGSSYSYGAYILSYNTAMTEAAVWYGARIWLVDDRGWTNALSQVYGAYIRVPVMSALNDCYALYTQEEEVYHRGGATIGHHLMHLSQTDADEPFIFYDGLWTPDLTGNLSTMNGDGVCTGPLDTNTTQGWVWVGMVRVETPTIGDVWMPVYQPDLAP